MKLPSEYGEDFLGYEGGFGAYPDGTPIRTRVYSLIYPPPGFFPFYGIGNGDYHGFYWSIGREDGPPIVGFSSHDAWSLIPENSDVESLYRCQLAKSDGDSDTLNCYRDLAQRAVSTFRERYHLNPSTYGTRLAELLQLAGNTLRAELIRNMLSKIEKPEGQYL
jgi:hypothetical protein